MNQSDNIKLPSLYNVINVLALPFMIMLIAVFAPWAVINSLFHGFELENYLFLFITFLIIIIFIILFYKLAMFKALKLGGEKIEFISRFGENHFVFMNEIRQINYYKIFQTELNRIGLRDEDEGITYSEDIIENEETFYYLKGSIFPARIKTKDSNYFLFLNEGLYMKLKKGLDAENDITQKESMRYNENWNWVIFILAIVGVILTFIFLLSKMKGR